MASRYHLCMRIQAFSDLPVVPLGAGAAIQKHMIAGAGQVPNLRQFVRACFEPGQTAAAHSHADMTEVFYIESGKGTLVVDGISHALEAGTSFCVEPGERHELSSAGSSPLVVIYASIPS